MKFVNKDYDELVKKHIVVNKITAYEFDSMGTM